MDYSGRRRRLGSRIEENGFDCLIVTHLPNIRYLCGFTGSAGVLLLGDGGCVLFTDGRYRTQAKDETSGITVEIGAMAPVMSAAEWLLDRAARKKPGSRTSAGIGVGIEGESMTAGMRERLARALKGGSSRLKGASKSASKSEIRLKLAPPLIEQARMVKDAEEVAAIRRAIELGASLFSVAREKIRPGVKEVEVAAAMEYAARSGGVEGMSFGTIVAAGARSAVVHGRASAARIPRRGFVVCDFGVILAGYCSDRTRTVHVGRPSAEERSVYEAVLEAQLAAIARVRGGVSVAEVDGAARNVLKKRKLDRYFTHSTGHGLGLEIHEAPRLAAGQDVRLEAGMVVTIEPGVYVPGKLGVRIEDVVVVTRSGCEVLTGTEKELVVV
jgi:Xaa-Pro aminopeptidase